MKDLDTKPNKEFEMAVLSAGSLVIQCEFCGRVYFATESENNYGKGELEGLRKQVEKDPDKYIEDGTCDGISWGMIDNRQVVLGCKCNILSRYEKWIQNHRYIITDYFKSILKKSESELINLKETVEVMENVRLCLDQLNRNLIKMPKKENNDEHKK